METFIYILIFLLMILIALQDFRFRAVSWYLFPLVAVVILVLQFNRYPLRMVLEYTIINLLLIGLQFLLLSLYFSIKEKRFVFLINSKIGLGDIFLLLILCPVFFPLNFIFFLLFVTISGLLVTGVTMAVSKNTNPSIPLASYLSIGFILILIADFFKILNAYEDYIFSIINYH